MDTDYKVLILNLPSPQNQTLWRDTAGGYGTSLHYPSNVKVNSSTPLHPFLPYAASVLGDAGIEFSVIDCQRLGLNNHQTIEIAKKISPNIIFSIISLPSMHNDLEVLNAIAKSIQNVTTIGVGTVCRVMPDEVLSKNKIDLLLRNSYPYINGMIELIKTLQKANPPKNLDGISYAANGQIINTSDLPEFEFDKLPNPNYDCIPLEGYDTFPDKFGHRRPYVLIVDSKGCPYGCVYCAYPLGYGRKFTFRSPSQIVDEIEYLHQKRGINIFAFKGQSFAYNKTHAKMVCDEIKNRKLEITWFCESRVDEVNQEYLTRMKEAGCERIHYGVETGDIATLKIAKPGVTLEITKKAFRITKMNNIATQAHVVLGWPDDTRETLENTRKFLLDLDPDVLNLNFLTPYPGTKIYDLACEKSLLLTRNWSNYTSHSVVMRTKSLNADQLYAIKNRIIRDFSLRKIETLLSDHYFQNLNSPQQFVGRMRALVNKALFPSLD
jgi:uncharacterized radical SAM superfamily protein